MRYVVVKPEVAKGIYASWDECWAALHGTKGERRYMKVSSTAEAEAILSGQGVVLPSGEYAFTDGNAAGGVGVVLVRMSEEAADPEVISEISTSVHRALLESRLAGLSSEEAISDALEAHRNVLAELVALYVAIDQASHRCEVKVVHDFVGFRDWMTNVVKAPREGPLRVLVEECARKRDERHLVLEFLHQPGHRSTWAGRHDLAHFNARADQLATKGVINDPSDV